MLEKKVDRDFIKNEKKTYGNKVKIMVNVQIRYRGIGRECL